LRAPDRALFDVGAVSDSGRRFAYFQGRPRSCRDRCATARGGEGDIDVVGKGASACNRLAVGCANLFLTVWMSILDVGSPASFPARPNPRDGGGGRRRLCQRTPSHTLVAQGPTFTHPTAHALGPYLPHSVEALSVMDPDELWLSSCALTHARRLTQLCIDEDCLTAAHRLFTALDKDGDGTLSIQEANGTTKKTRNRTLAHHITATPKTVHGT
jgi:hypothetical protein